MYRRVSTTSINCLIQYVPLTKDKLSGMLELVRNSFFLHEPVSVAVGLSKQPEAIRELDRLILTAVKDGVSLVAVENAGEKVVGFVINKIISKKHFEGGYFKKFNYKCSAVKKYLHVNTVIDNAVNIFDRFQTNCYCETMFSSVLPEFRRKGVATKLQIETFKIMQHLANEENVKVSINDEHLPLRPIPSVLVAFPTAVSSKNLLVNIGSYTKDVEIDLPKLLKNKGVLPASVISNIPHVPLMYKYFVKL